MLHLPPGQGFSIYSLAALLPLLPAKQRRDRPERLDVDRRRGRLPRSELPDPLPHHAHRQAPLQPCRGDGGAAAGRSAIVTVADRSSLRPGYAISRVICGGWQLAGGHGAVDRDAAVADLVAFCRGGITTFDCADIYTGVEELIGAMRAEYGRRHGAAALAADQGAHQMRARPRHARRDQPRLRSARSSTRSLQRLAHRAARPRPVPLVGLRRARLSSTARWLARRAAARRQDRPDRRNQFRHAAHGRDLVAAGVDARQPCRSSIRCSTIGRSTAWSISAGGTTSIFSSTARSPAASSPTAGSARREPQPPFENRSLTKYKLIIDDFGGWDLFQDVAARRCGGSPIATAPTSPRSRAAPCSTGRMVAAVIVGARNRAHLAANVGVSACRSPRPITPRSTRCSPTEGPEGDTFALERDRTGRHGSIMKYNLNRPLMSARRWPTAPDEVVELHAFFVAWFRSDAPAGDFALRKLRSVRISA